MITKLIAIVLLTLHLTDARPMEKQNYIPHTRAMVAILGAGLRALPLLHVGTCLRIDEGECFANQKGCRLKDAAQSLREAPENPIWTLARSFRVIPTSTSMVFSSKKYIIYQAYFSISYYQSARLQKTRPSVFMGLFGDYGNAYSVVQRDAGYVLSQNLQERSFRSVLSLVNWKPPSNMNAQVLGWH